MAFEGLALKHTLFDCKSVSHESVCASACGADDWLCEFFLDEFLDAPDFSVIGSPLFVGVDVIGKANEFKGEFASFSASCHFVIDKILDSKFPITDLDWVVGWHLALCEDCEELALVALDTSTDVRNESVSAWSEDALSFAEAVMAHPADGVNASFWSDHFIVATESEQGVHYSPRGAFRGCFGVVEIVFEASSDSFQSFPLSGGPIEFAVSC